MATVCWLLLLVTMMAGMIQAGRETPSPHSLESVDKSVSFRSRDPMSQPLDCYEILATGSSKGDGVYTIHVGWRNHQLTPVKVYCDMTRDGGGWTVILKRKDGSVGFFRPWNVYKKGFGKADGEYWLGNDNIHMLTSLGRQKMRVDMGDYEGINVWADYTNFLVGSEEEEYKLWSIGKFNGTAGDSLVIQNGQKFSTMDKGVNKNLASGYSGAWWYHPNSRIVAHSHLTGLYLYGKNNMARKGVNWHHFKGLSYSLKFAEMKIRPFYA